MKCASLLGIITHPCPISTAVSTNCYWNSGMDNKNTSCYFDVNIINVINHLCPFHDGEAPWEGLKNTKLHECLNIWYHEKIKSCKSEMNIYTSKSMNTSSLSWILYTNGHMVVMMVLMKLMIHAFVFCKNNCHDEMHGLSSVEKATTRVWYSGECFVMVLLLTHIFSNILMT